MKDALILIMSLTVTFTRFEGTWYDVNIIQIECLKEAYVNWHMIFFVYCVLTSKIIKDGHICKT